MGGEPQGEEGFRASLDQTQASVRDIAPLVATAYTAMRKMGLEEGEAVALSATFFQISAVLRDLFGIEASE